jgi:hypothetical protein
MVSEAKKTYLQRVWLTVIVAFLLAYFPPDGWFVRFICLFLFAILAGWTQNAQIRLEREVKRPW